MPNPRWATESVGDDPTTELSRRWYYGWPGMGGSEDGRTRFHSTIGFIKEGVASQHNFRPHRFFTPPVDVFFASGYFIRLEQVVEGIWQPVEHYGKPFDDQYQDMKIVWRPDTMPGFGTWEIDLVLPAELAHAFLRVHLPQRPNFRRLAANIPRQDGVVWTAA